MSVEHESLTSMQGSIIQHFDWWTSKLSGWLDSSEGPVSPLHLLYMGYSIVVNFVDASVCRFSIHNCGLLQANPLNGILIPEVEVADPEFLLLLEIMLLDVNRYCALLFFFTWCSFWNGIQSYKYHFLRRNLESNQLNGNLPLFLSNLTNLQVLWVILQLTLSCLSNLMAADVCVLYMFLSSVRTVFPLRRWQ
jgi:hypothetical protein